MLSSSFACKNQREQTKNVNHFGFIHFWSANCIVPIVYGYSLQSCKTGTNCNRWASFILINNYERQYFLISYKIVWMKGKEERLYQIFKLSIKKKQKTRFIIVLVCSITSYINNVYKMIKTYSLLKYIYNIKRYNR